MGDPLVVELLASFDRTMMHVLRFRMAAKPILSDWRSALAYLSADMGHLPVERVRILYLNSRNGLIDDRIASQGCIDEAAVYVREVVRQALDCGAAALIIAHNHPTGDPQPSRADIMITRNLQAAARVFGIAVHDHMIIGSAGHASLRGLGLL